MLTRRMFTFAGASLLALPPTLALGQEKLAMQNLYSDADFSEQARMFNGTSVTLDGFMAPPLKPDVKFFVLGTAPMAICPFCDAASQWPQNIVLIYPKDRMRLFNYDQAITVTGKLEIGTNTDQETGFVSKVRLIEADYKGLPSVSIGF